MEKGGEKKVGASTSAGKQSAASSSRRFQRELRSMMFGFGDDRHPQTETVELLEDMVIDYVRQLLQKAQEVSEHRELGSKKAGKAKVRDRDLLFVLRKDRRRYERAVELLEVWKEVKAARSSGDATLDAKALDKLDGSLDDKDFLDDD
jgi:transcription initiation factor TFIID subunit 13